MFVPCKMSFEENSSFERLDDLVEVHENVNDKDVMKKYFGEPAPIKPNKSTIKVLGYALLLFILLANPWVDTLFCKLPYCGVNNISVFGTKCLLFTFLFMIMYSFFC